MNGWIIHKKALGENHEVKRLVEEFENQGVKIRVVNPRDAVSYTHLRAHETS